MTASEADERAIALKQRRKIGRPTKYSEALCERVCNLVAQGKSLRTIQEYEGMPNITTILEWLSDGKHELFAKQYQHARAARAELLAEEALEISDDKTGDLIEGENGVMPNSANVNRAKLQVHARHWYASKLAPKAFGDAQQANVAVNLSLSTLIGQSFTDTAGAKLVQDLRGAGPGAVDVTPREPAAIAGPVVAVERASAPVKRETAPVERRSAPAERLAARKKIKKKVKGKRAP